MNQKIVGVHNLDEKGNPAGGITTGVGIEIKWQDGPLAIQNELGVVIGRREPNGAFVEGVIAAAIDRLEHYQTGKFKSRENALAITKLEEALHWCHHRTAKREAQGVEGTHQVHV